nr:MAG TPA: hypothetical protein [Caudoviricetes sp.]
MRYGVCNRCRLLYSNQLNFSLYPKTHVIDTHVLWCIHYHH